MKKYLYLPLMAICAIMILPIVSCGNNNSQEKADEETNEQARIDSLAQVKANEMIANQQASVTNDNAEHVGESPKVEAYVAPGNTYTFSCEEYRGYNPELTTIHYRLEFYNDGTATLTQDWDGNIKTFEGRMKKKTQSYHDKNYEWYFFDGKQKGDPRVVQRYNIETNGDVYSTTSLVGKIEDFVDKECIAHLQKQ